MKKLLILLILSLSFVGCSFNLSGNTIIIKEVAQVEESGYKYKYNIYIPNDSDLLYNLGSRANPIYDKRVPLNLARKLFSSPQDVVTSDSERKATVLSNNDYFNIR